MIAYNPVFAGCEQNRVKLQVLGSGGPELNDQRASTSYLIWIDNKASILIDTGTGSSSSFEKSGADFVDIKAILFTHLHVDHSQDLPAYIKGSFFSSRNNNLYIYGPDGNDLMPSTSSFIESLFGVSGAYKYLNNYLNENEISGYKILVEDISLQRYKIHTSEVESMFTIASIAVHHGPIAAIAWRVNVLGCSITFSGDMSNHSQSLTTLAKQSDILVAHNAIPENATGVGRNLHMPPSEIGKIATEADIQKLILSHRMQRTLGKEEETKKIIQNEYEGEVFFANDLDVYAL